MRKCTPHPSIAALVGMTLAFAVATPVAAQSQTVPGDLSVQGSQCVGSACTASEAFGFDTLRLKSNTPQIRFVDTSTSAAFPTQDWLMGVEDGVANSSVFFVKDATANSYVMRLTSTAGGGVALGAGAELIANAVSVGGSGTERRIRHVAPGVAPTDAVNLGQLQTLSSQLNDLNTRITGLTNRLNAVTVP